MERISHRAFGRVVLATAFLLLGISSVFANTFTGTLDASDPTFNRPASCSALSTTGTAVHYKVFNFTVITPQGVTISLSAADGADFITPSNSNNIDTFIVLYDQGGFDPASPLTNCLAVNDDANGSTDKRSRLVTGVLSSGTYTYVVTSVENNPSGASLMPWAYTGFISNMITAAAAVRVSGRVFTPQGIGISRARVSIIDSSGITLTAMTNNFGYYTFEAIRIGESYVFSVVSKQHQFTPQVVSINDELSDLNFTALQ